MVDKKEEGQGLDFDQMIADEEEYLAEVRDR